MSNRSVRYVGIAQGSGQEQPEFFLDALEAGLDSPEEADVEVESSIGNTARQKMPGVWIPTGPINYNADIRSIVHMLKAGLHGYAATEELAADGVTPTGYTIHEIWADDARYLDEHCVRIGKDETEDGFERSVLGSFEMSVERSTVPINMNWAACNQFENPVKDLDAEIYPNLYDEQVLMWSGIGAYIDEDANGDPIDESPFVKSLGLSFDNNLNSEDGVTVRSRFPRRHVMQGRTFEASMNIHFEDNKHRRRFWGRAVEATEANIGPSNEGSVELPVRIALDPSKAPDGTVFGEGEILLPKTYYKGVPRRYTGREQIEQQVPFGVLTGKVALLDGTEINTPIYARIRNRQPSLVAA